MACNDDVIELALMLIHSVSDPVEGDRKVVIGQPEDQDVFADDVIIDPFISRHVNRILRDVVLHVFDPVLRIGVAGLVVAHDRKEFDAFRRILVRHRAPFSEFDVRAVVGQIAEGQHDIDAFFRLVLQQFVHRVDGDMRLACGVRSALRIGQQPDDVRRRRGFRFRLRRHDYGRICIDRLRIFATRQKNRRSRAGIQHRLELVHLLSPQNLKRLKSPPHRSGG